MTRTIIPTVDQYWETLARLLPPFTQDDQRAAVTLYRELAKGQPVDATQLGRALGVTPAEARGFLDQESIRAFVYPDAEGRVVGFGGLAAAPMHHTLEVDGRTLWTWCAWDSLFIPEILGKRARVVSPDPETGELVELYVTPNKIDAAKPPAPSCPSCSPMRTTSTPPPRTSWRSSATSSFSSPPARRASAG